VAKSIYTKDYGRFLELLVKARREADLTQVEVASRLGRPQSYVSKYENGERRLDVIEFLEIARAVGFDAVRLIRRLA
jgi:transcriptional regulator with XRE-family HTH domain